MSDFFRHFSEIVSRKLNTRSKPDEMNFKNLVSKITDKMKLIFNIGWFFGSIFWICFFSWVKLVWILLVTSMLIVVCDENWGYWRCCGFLAFPMLVILFFHVKNTQFWYKVYRFFLGVLFCSVAWKSSVGVSANLEVAKITL